MVKDARKKLIASCYTLLLFSLASTMYQGANELLFCKKKKNSGNSIMKSVISVLSSHTATIALAKLFNVIDTGHFLILHCTLLDIKVSESKKTRKLNILF